MGGVTLQIVRDWVLKLNAGGLEALVDYRGPGPQKILTDAHRTALARAVEDGPIPAIHGVVRWRVIDLVQWMLDEFDVSVSKQTLSRKLRQMGGAAQGSARLAGGMAAEGIAGCRHVRVTTLRLPARSRLLKNSHHASGLDQARGGHRPRRRRSLVRRRSPGRAEEQDHPALGEACQRFRSALPNGMAGRGQARHTAVRAAGPAHGVDLYLRRHLSGDGRDGRSGPALVQHGGDGSAPGRDRRSGHAGQALRAPGRSGRLAHLGPARGSSQHHNRSAAGQVPGVEPGRERLAVPARQLVVEPDLPLIRRHRRSLLRRVEPPCRAALARHEPRITKLDARSPAVSLVGVDGPTASRAKVGLSNANKGPSI